MLPLNSNKPIKLDVFFHFALLKSLNKTKGHLFSKEELEKVKELKCLSRNLFGISDIKYLKYLEKVYFSYCDINTIEGVSDLQNLTKLFFASNKITDISPLQNMVWLEEIDFNDNQITNIEALSKLINLKYIKFRKNNIEDIAPLVKNYENGGLRNNTFINLGLNPLNEKSINEYLPYLKKNDVSLSFYQIDEFGKLKNYQ